jgi:hypothetical protein
MYIKKNAPARQSTPSIVGFFFKQQLAQIVIGLAEYVEPPMPCCCSRFGQKG